MNIPEEGAKNSGVAAEDIPSASRGRLCTPRQGHHLLWSGCLVDAIIKWGQEKDPTWREENTERRFERGKSGESEGLPGKYIARLGDRSSGV